MFKVHRNNSGTTFLLAPATGETYLLSESAWEQIYHTLKDNSCHSILDSIANQNSSDNNNPSALRFFMIDLTSICSNRCSYCFRDLQHPKIIASHTLNNILNAIIAHCAEHSINKIQLQGWGGEPLLAWDKICHIQASFEKAGIDARILVETNGVSITQQIATEMYQRGIVCSISIDGPQCIHDYCRRTINGHGSYDNAIRGLNLLRDAGYGNRIGCVCVITKSSLPHIEQIINHLAYDLKFARVKLNIIKDSSQLLDKSLCISDDLLSEFWIKVLSTIIRINNSGVSFGESTILSMLHNLTTHRPMSFCYSKGCQAGHRMISFDMDGNVYPCDQTDIKELSIGNILNDSISSLTKSSANNLQSFFALPLPDECSQCDWRAYCKGGCRTMRWLSHHPGHVDIATCVRNKTLYPLLIELILEKPDLITSISGNEIRFE